MRAAMEAHMEVSVVPSAQIAMTAFMDITYYGGPHDGARETLVNAPEEIRVPQFRMLRYNIDGEKRETNVLVGWAIYKMDFTQRQANHIGFLQNQL